MNRIPIKDQLLNKQIISYQKDGNITADTQIQKYRHGDQRDTTAFRDREGSKIQVQCLINSTDVSHQLQSYNGINIH